MLSGQGILFVLCYNSNTHNSVWHKGKIKLKLLLLFLLMYIFSVICNENIICIIHFLNIVFQKNNSTSKLSVLHVTEIEMPFTSQGHKIEIII